MTCCGRRGCTTVEVTPMGGGIDVAVERRQGDGLSVSAKRARDTGIAVGLKLLCQSSQGVWEFLHVREGQVIDINGQQIVVRRYVQD